MNKSDQVRLRKVLDDLERKSRSRGSGWRFPTSSLVFGAGLGLADYLLFDFVPRTWSTLLPGGLEQAATLQGNASTVWRLAILVQQFQSIIPIAIAVASIGLMIVGSMSRMVRIGSWLGAFGAILLNAWIVATVVRAGWAATAEATGFDQHLSL